MITVLHLYTSTKSKHPMIISIEYMPYCTMYNVRDQMEDINTEIYTTYHEPLRLHKGFICQSIINTVNLVLLAATFVGVFGQSDIWRRFKLAELS